MKFFKYLYMKLFFTFTYLIIQLVVNAQIDHLINTDSLLYYKYSKINTFEIKDVDTILRSTYYYNSIGNLDSIVDYDNIFAFDENGKMFNTKKGYTIKSIYTYTDDLLTKKTEVLLDTIIRNVHIYYYDKKNQRIKDVFKSLPYGKENITTYKYKNGLKILEFDSTDNISHYYVYDRKQRLVKTYNSSHKNDFTSYTYIGENKSVVSYSSSIDNDFYDIWIRQNNENGQPILVTTSSINSSNEINKFFYEKGLLQVYENFFMYDSKFVTKEYFFLKYE